MYVPAVSYLSTLGQQGFDQGDRLLVQPVPSICSNTTTTAAKFKVAFCGVGGGEGGLSLPLCAQLLTQNFRTFPVVCEFNV